MAHPVVRGSAATPGAMAHWRVRDAAGRWRGLLAPAAAVAALLVPGPALADAGAPSAAAAAGGSGAAATAASTPSHPRGRPSALWRAYPLRAGAAAAGSRPATKRDGTVAAPRTASATHTTGSSDTSPTTLGGIPQMALIAVILAGSVLFLILVSTGLARSGRLRTARPGRLGHLRHGRVAVAGIGLMAVEDTRTRREAPSPGTVPTTGSGPSAGTAPRISGPPSQRRRDRGFVIDDAAVAETPEVAAAREQSAALLKEAQDRAEALVTNAEVESVALRRRAEDDTERAAQVLVEAQRSAAQVLADVRDRSRELEETAEQQAAERLFREATAPRVQVRRFDVAAVAAVIEREVLVWLRTWRTMTFAAIIEPIIFLLAFGLGIGAMIKRVQGVDYIQFVGTGVVATTVVFSSAFPSMFQTFVKSRFQKLYDAILSTPVDVGELVTADMLWTATRTGVYALAPLIVAVGFGLRPNAGVALVPLIAFITAFGFAGFGISIAARAKAITSFNYVISGLLTPLLLVAGAYFPVEQLPHWAFILNQFNPLYHCVQLVRHAVFGIEIGNDVWHLAALLLFGLITWTVSVRLLKPTLID